MLLIVHQCFLMILSRKSIARKTTLQTTNNFLHSLTNQILLFTHQISEKEFAVLCECYYVNGKDLNSGIIVIPTYSISYKNYSFFFTPWFGYYCPLRPYTFLQRLLTRMFLSPFEGIHKLRHTLKGDGGGRQSVTLCDKRGEES